MRSRMLAAMVAGALLCVSVAATTAPRLGNGGGGYELDPLQNIPNPFTTVSLAAGDLRRVPAVPRQQQTQTQQVGGSQLLQERRQDAGSAADKHVNGTGRLGVHPVSFTRLDQDDGDENGEEEDDDEEEEEEDYDEGEEEEVDDQEGTTQAEAPSTQSASTISRVESNGVSVSKGRSAQILLNPVLAACSASRLAASPARVDMHMIGSSTGSRKCGTVELAPVRASSATITGTRCSGHLVLRDFTLHPAPIFAHLFLTTLPAATLSILRSPGRIGSVASQLGIPAGWTPTGPAVSQALGNHDNTTALYMMPSAWVPGPYDGVALYSVHDARVLAVGVPARATESAAAWAVLQRGNGQYSGAGPDFVWPNGVNGFSGGSSGSASPATAGLAASSGHLRGTSGPGALNGARGKASIGRRAPAGGLGKANGTSEGDGEAASRALSRRSGVATFGLLALTLILTF